MNHNRVWAALTAVFAVVFAVTETDAILVGRRNRGKPLGTLSVWIRARLGLESKHWRRFILVPLFVLFCGWFCPHIVFGIWNWGVIPE